MVRQNGTGPVVYKNTGDIDAIDQHSRYLVDALVKGGYPALYRADGLPRAREIDSGALEGVHAVAPRGCRPRVADPAQVARCLCGAEPRIYRRCVANPAPPSPPK